MTLFGHPLTVSLLQGDGMHNSGALLPDLVNDGIRLLLYAGEADMRMALCCLMNLAE